MEENLNYKKEEENKEIIILNNKENLTHDIFDKFCNLQKLIKKESSLIQLCKKK